MKTFRIILFFTIAGTSAFLAASFFAKLGHGTNIPFILLFPFSGFLSSTGEIGFYGAALVQYPIYGILLSVGIKRNHKYEFLRGIILAHFFAVAALGLFVLLGISL